MSQPLCELRARGGAWIVAVQVTVSGNQLQIGQGQNASILAQPGAYLALVQSFSTGNTSNIKAGGLFVQTSATVDLYESVISGNSASQYGGGVHVQGTLNCNGSIVYGNSAGIRGGGIYKTSSGTLNMTSCSVYGNSAPSNPDIFQ